jgi:hypothetical protein
MWIWIKISLDFDEKKGVGWWRLEGVVESQGCVYIVGKEWANKKVIGNA